MTLVYVSAAWLFIGLVLGLVIGRAIALANRRSAPPRMPNLVLLRGDDPQTSAQLFPQLPPVRAARIDELA